MSRLSRVSHLSQGQFTRKLARHLLKLSNAFWSYAKVIVIMGLGDTFISKNQFQEIAPYNLLTNSTIKYTSLLCLVI